MKRLFVDTNVLLDVLLERHPFCAPAQGVWSAAAYRKVQAGISTLSVGNVFFIVQRLASTEKAYRAVETLAGIFRMVAVGPRTIARALQLRWPDFEDAVQYRCALHFRARAIISRDPAGFLDSAIPVMDCAHYLALAERR